MGNSIRTFIAFASPVDLVQLAGALQTDLKKSGLRLRWVRPDNIHLTLKFLGDIAPQQAAAVADAMQTAALDIPVLPLTVQGMGVFPNMRQPRVLWVGLGGQIDGLRQLHAALEMQLAALGFAMERRPFRAHLTLARIKEPPDQGLLRQALETAGQYAPGCFQAEELILFQSVLQPGGATYTPLARVRLGEGG
ncbi:MAG: RNA 2',3'-cyclic phosphodiesterase [Desulfatitalea sp.]|nr:RNA 2',3'-cyclic phosphodiesterase [Desulfatitalea sp.]